MGHVVAGVRVPDQVAQHPGLELCNTRANWPGPAEHEYLHSAWVVAVWGVDVGLLPGASIEDVEPLAPAMLPAAGRHPDDDAILLQAKRFRAALYACATGDPTVGRLDPDDQDVDPWVPIRAAAVAARDVAVLDRPSRDARARWRVDPALVRDALVDARHRDRPDALAALALHGAALAAEDLLLTTDPADVHACPGVGCGWLFVDPRGRRRWCTMAVCGNRAKVRRHAQRQRSAAGVIVPRTVDRA